MTKITENPTFTLPSGVELKLKPIPPFIFMAVLSNAKDKPAVPYHEVRIAGKIKSEPNYYDENYLKAVEDYEQQRNMKVMRLLFTEGVVGAVEDYIKDKDKIKDIKRLVESVYGEDYSDDDYKYIWLSTELPDDTVAEQFQDAVQQLSSPTEDAIEDSKSGV